MFGKGPQRDCHVAVTNSKKSSHTVCASRCGLRCTARREASCQHQLENTLRICRQIAEIHQRPKLPGSIIPARVLCHGSAQEACSHHLLLPRPGHQRTVGHCETLLQPAAWLECCSCCLSLRRQLPAEPLVVTLYIVKPACFQGLAQALRRIGHDKSRPQHKASRTCPLRQEWGPSKVVTECQQLEENRPGQLSCILFALICHAAQICFQHAGLRTAAACRAQPYEWFPELCLSQLLPWSLFF